MDKVLALVELKERINTVGFNRYQYIGVDEDTGQKCFCSVGHLLDICGVDMEPILEDEEINSYPVTNYRTREAVVEPLLELGFTETQLDRIQTLNDADNKATLNSYIDGLIAGTEDD